MVRAALCLAVLGATAPCTAPEQPLRVPAVRRCRAVSFRRDHRDEAGAVGVRLRGGGAEDGVRGGGGGPGWELGRSERDNVVRVGGQPQGIMEDDEDENGIQFRDGGGMVVGGARRLRPGGEMEVGIWVLALRAPRVLLHARREVKFARAVFARAGRKIGGA